MNRRNFIRTSSSAGISMFFAPSVKTFAPIPLSENTKKNMIWIFGDQLRGQALSYMGDPNSRTPFLNELSLEATTFTQAVSGCPWSTPFRGSLLTSKYNHQSVYKTPQYLSRDLPLITDVFKQHRYLTAYFGKWHLFGHNSCTFVPRADRGRFDIWLGYENNNNQYDSWIHDHNI